MSTDTRPTPTPDNPMGELPFGYTQLGPIDEMICDEGCGEVYYQRGYITPDRMAVIERTPCRCMMEKYNRQKTEWDISETRTRQANLTYNAERYFGGYDLLMDKAYDRMTFDNYKPINHSQQDALKRLQGFTPGQDNICLYGAAGRGKTHLAMSVARIAKGQGNVVLAIKAIDMLTRLKRTYDRKDDEAEIEIMRLLKDVDLLVIDDIGTEHTTEWVRSKFYEVIEYRHRRKSTVLTTNLTGAEMKAKEGSALVSRIMSAEICLEIEGNDHRMRRD